MLQRPQEKPKHPHNKLNKIKTFDSLHMHKYCNAIQHDLQSHLMSAFYFKNGSVSCAKACPRLKILLVNYLHVYIKLISIITY